MASMVAARYVNHVPTMTGGVGHDQLKRFYKYHFIGGNPGDRLRAAGYTSYRWAENLGCRSGDARSAVLGSVSSGPSTFLLASEMAPFIGLGTLAYVTTAQAHANSNNAVNGTDFVGHIGGLAHFGLDQDIRADGHGWTPSRR